MKKQLIILIIAFIAIGMFTFCKNPKKTESIEKQEESIDEVIEEEENDDEEDYDEEDYDEEDGGFPNEIDENE